MLEMLVIVVVGLRIVACAPDAANNASEATQRQRIHFTPSSKTTTKISDEIEISKRELAGIESTAGFRCTCQLHTSRKPLTRDPDALKNTHLDRTLCNWLLSPVN